MALQLKSFVVHLQGAQHHHHHHHPRRFSATKHPRPSPVHATRFSLAQLHVRALATDAAPLDSTLHHGKWPTFWKKIPMYANVEEGDFLDYRWQVGNSIQSKEQVYAFLDKVLQKEADKALQQDVMAGIKSAPMSISLTPYLLSCIDWTHPLDDPIRKQFLPLASTRQQDHPMGLLDPLTEELQNPVPGLIHRYPDKALLVSTTVCPIYCRFCFRSYIVGNETDTTKKQRFGKSSRQRLRQAFDYLRTHPQIEDLTISGGDMFFLSADDIEYIGTTLLSIPHIRRFRFGTRGLTAAPMRILNDPTWTNVICGLAKRGREQGKHVALHLHFNHANEITWITELAALKLYQNGVTLRNQSVVLRGVNDSVASMSALIKKLSYNNIHPYYVFQGDMVKGVEDLRTPLSTTLHLEKQVQGLTAGFNVPKFILDLPLGGGKQLAHHYESYDPIKGVAIYESRIGERKIMYCDPLHALSPSIQQDWLSGELNNDVYC